MHNRRISEQVLEYFKKSGTSNLTKKHYQTRLTKEYSYGLQEIVLTDSDLRLVFLVVPTFRNGKPVKNKKKASRKSQYTVEIQFVNASEYIDIDLPDTMSSSDLKEGVDSMIDGCDLKFYSDDPSFYWQGFWEDLDASNSAIYPFEGTKGDHTWEDRHADSGGLLNSKIRVTKHITQILIDMKEKHKDKIIRMLAGGMYTYD